MLTRVPQVALSSKLPSSVATYQPQRYSGPANPVGNPLIPTRAMQGYSSPRHLHPKLNKSSWSYSYAQEPATAKPGKGDGKPKRGGRKRVRNGSRGRRAA